MLAVLLASLMMVTPLQVQAVTGSTETETLNFNQDGNQGTVVYSADVLEGQAGSTFGIRLSNFVGGTGGTMRQVNIAVAFDGVVADVLIGAREGQLIPFTIPTGAQNFSIIASTNENGENRISGFNLEIVARTEGTDTFVPGTYPGTASNGGHYYMINENPEPANVQVAVTVSETEILNIEILEHHDTEAFFNRANPGLVDSILFAQSTDVDMVTGATHSSEGILEAVADALAAARAGEVMSSEEVTMTEETTEEATTEETVVEPVDMPTVDVIGTGVVAGLPTATATFTPGTHVVSATGHNAETPIELSVTFSENQITDVTVLSHEESFYGSGWGHRSLPMVPDTILVQQSTLGFDDMDIRTGATESRDAVIEAVNEAITLAGANPGDLAPQSIDAPLEGDRFIPGFVQVVVPANTMDTAGNPLAEGATSMLHSDEDMNILVSFGRNTFHVWGGNTTNANLAHFGFNGSHGESAYATAGVTLDNISDAISGGTWGGFFFRQVAQHQINDQQSTLGVDVNTGATQSASGIVWGVEQAMTQAGANPADITPLGVTTSQMTRSHDADASTPLFIAGIYDVTVDGAHGPIDVRVTLDRNTIRRIEILNHSENADLFDTVWGNPADHVLRNNIFLAQAAGLADVDTVSGATVTSGAILEAVQTAVERAWVN